jgi:integrase
MPIYPDIDKKTGAQKRRGGQSVWLVEICCNGIRYRRRHYGTKTEVAREEVRLYQKLLQDAGRVQTSKRLDPTFQEYAAWYVEYKRPKQKNVETTIRRIRNIQRFITAFGLGKKKLSEFSTQDVLNFMSWRRNSIISPVHNRPPSEVTIKRDIVCWKAMINFAVKNSDYFINYNYVAPVELVKERLHIFEGLTVDQFHRLIDAAPTHLKAVIMFAGYTGWRRSEVTGLTWRRVKLFDTGGVALLEDSKNGEARVTSLSNRLIATLKSLPSSGTCEKCGLGQRHTDAECQPVFTRAGKPIRDFKVGMRATYERSGLMHLYHEGKPFHRLRNFFRTNHADMGTDMSIIMQEGGWKDPNMMMRYLNQRRDIRKKIAEKYDDYIEKGSATIVSFDQKKASNG